MPDEKPNLPTETEIENMLCRVKGVQSILMGFATSDEFTEHTHSMTLLRDTLEDVVDALYPLAQPGAWEATK